MKWGECHTPGTLSHLSTHCLYLGISLAYRSLLDGESLPSRCSLCEQASMNVCPTTVRQESTMLVLWTSKAKSGFLMMFTQNLSGRLQNTGNSLQHTVKTGFSNFYHLLSQEQMNWCHCSIPAPTTHINIYNRECKYCAKFCSTTTILHGPTLT